MKVVRTSIHLLKSLASKETPSPTAATWKLGINQQGLQIEFASYCIYHIFKDVKKSYY